MRDRVFAPSRTHDSDRPGITDLTGSGYKMIVIDDPALQPDPDGEKQREALRWFRRIVSHRDRNKHDRTSP